MWEIMVGLVGGITDTTCTIHSAARWKQCQTEPRIVRVRIWSDRRKLSPSRLKYEFIKSERFWDSGIGYAHFRCRKSQTSGQCWVFHRWSPGWYCQCSSPLCSFDASSSRLVVRTWPRWWTASHRSRCRGSRDTSRRKQTKESKRLLSAKRSRRGGSCIFARPPASLSVRWKEHIFILDYVKIGKSYWIALPRKWCTVQ